MDVSKYLHDLNLAYTMQHNSAPENVRNVPEPMDQETLRTCRSSSGINKEDAALHSESSDIFTQFNWNLVSEDQKLFSSQ
jgi:hypothetical protein